MKCIVVDDEPLARKGMQLLIEQVPHLRLLACFANAVDANEFMKNNPVDILFLDIQMPKINGIEFMKSMSSNVKVVITTAYPQFALEAFEYDVADYLVKPIRFERFYKAINKIDRLSGKSQAARYEADYIFIRAERKYIRTHYNEIDYIEGLKDYVIVHCGSQKHIVAANLKTITASLPVNLFLRISKSFVINTSKIKSIDNNVVIINIKELPIGESFKSDVLGFLKNKQVFKRE